MNKKDAKIIAETITNEQLQEMFNQAKANIVNWNVRSNINKGISKGVAWNILYEYFGNYKKYIALVKINMVREFGEFLPYELKPKKQNKKLGKFFHQEPKF